MITATDTQTNVQTVQQLYEAFGKHDIPGILALIDDNFSWIDPGEGPNDIPYAGHYKGRAGFGEFFQKMNATADVLSFTVHSLQGVDDQVFARGNMTMRSKQTGKSGTTDFLMVWNFNEGKLAGGQAFLDTNTVAKAFRQ